jgi:acetyl-CoA synthetase
MTDNTIYSSSINIAASAKFKQNANIKSKDIYEKAKDNLEEFWEEQARQLTWFKTWDTVHEWNRPFAKWFLNGKLNASVNCVDRHANSERKHKKAIIWQGEDGRKESYTYLELSEQVNKFATVLRQNFSVKKGDRVTLYMPLIPQLAIAVLACARIGAIHSVVFGGFSAQSLRDRIIDSQSSVLITADGGYRRGNIIELKHIVDEAVSGLGFNQKILVYKHLNNEINWVEGRDYDLKQLLQTASSDCEPERMDSEDPLFILYTSGTTGKPKGILHTTGGYLTHAMYSSKLVFDLKDSDVYWCTADIGWITGHTYLIYGPLCNGATVFMYEGTPDYPDKGIFWKLIEEYGITILYTAPTAIRSFMKWGKVFPESYDLSSLRLLGSVGEPINPEAWQWYYDHIGNKNCPIVDTWWQTETGGIMISNIPALNDMKPGVAGLPLPGISADVLDKDGQVINEGRGLLSLTKAWPSMARGIWGDNTRFAEVYWSKFESYFCGDAAVKDKDGYFMVIGRVDDVINIAGHRIGTMEVESALVDCNKVAEAAVIGVADDIKGQALMAFVILKESTIDDEIALKKELSDQVCKSIGAIAKPKYIVFVPDLPKTRSGKIMRRILKDIASGTDIGDTTSLASSEIIDVIKQRTEKEMNF